MGIWCGVVCDWLTTFPICWVQKRLLCGWPQYPHHSNACHSTKVDLVKDLTENHRLNSWQYMYLVTQMLEICSVLLSVLLDRNTYKILRLLSPEKFPDPISSKPLTSNICNSSRFERVLISGGICDMVTWERVRTLSVGIANMPSGYIMPTGPRPVMSRWVRLVKFLK